MYIYQKTVGNYSLTLECRTIAIDNQLESVEYGAFDDMLSVAVNSTEQDRMDIDITLAPVTSALNNDLAGIKLETSVKLDPDYENGRVCIPALHYTKPNEIPCERIEYREDRLPSPFAVYYAEGYKLAFSKETLPQDHEKPERITGQSNYLHKTDVASLGFNQDRFISHWPYSEGAKSPSLNGEGLQANGFYPIKDLHDKKTIKYCIHSGEAGSFSEAIFQEFDGFAAKGDPARSVQDTFEDILSYKTESLGQSYIEFGENGAGFMFHFNPQKGYGSLPSGFGSAFNEIPEQSYRHILEYGFTGRQLNAAYLMAKNVGNEWIGRCEKVVDFFVSNLVEPNGWIYSLYDFESMQPVYSFGDPEAPKLHYVWNTDDKGNYLRTIAEPALDLLKCYRLMAEQGVVKEQWWEKVIAIAEFLVSAQNSDGSWYRGYKKDGTQAVIDKSGSYTSANAEKSATAIAIPFLCEVVEELDKKNAEQARFRSAIVMGGEYLLTTSVSEESFRGGTLDNPNLADKEAAQYVMAALLSIYQIEKERKYLNGSLIAGYQFISWNYTWDAPTEPGTILDEYHFRTRGMGGINSIWGGGVVDIYSLFHIKELYMLGLLTGIDRFRTFSWEIVFSSLQFVSTPETSFGFSGIGMQPEGWGICPEGCDENLIRKGDIWGSLGWIYSASIDGIGRFINLLKLSKEE